MNVTRLHQSGADDLFPLAALIGQFPAACTRSAAEPAAAYTVDSTGDAMLLGLAVFDVRRRRPLIVVGPGGGRRPLWSATAALDAVGRIADIVFITDHIAARAAEEILPTWWHLPALGARVFLPGADPGDPETRHPLVIARSRANAHDVLPALGDIVERWAMNPANGDLGLQLAAAEKTITELKTRAVNTDTALRSARAELDSTRAELASDHAPVFADSHAQFEHELWIRWLRMVPEDERATWPLREWEIGPLFLDSVEDVQTVSRTRIIGACVDAVTRRYTESAGRAAHQMPISGQAHSSSGYLTRARDGATAWRTAIHAGPSAPRLMFWEAPDDVVELSLVAVHDDVRIV